MDKQMQLEPQCQFCLCFGTCGLSEGGHCQVDAVTRCCSAPGCRRRLAIGPEALRTNPVMSTEEIRRAAVKQVREGFQRRWAKQHERRERRRRKAAAQKERLAA